MLTRSDKQPDRVEISPEQLSAASTEAEISFQTFGKGTKISKLSFQKPNLCYCSYVNIKHVNIMIDLLLWFINDWSLYSSFLFLPPSVFVQ